MGTRDATPQASASNALFRMFPQLEDVIPWTRLGDWPTPVDRIVDVPDGFRGELWVKRDDRSSVHYGGNKVRKLEYLLADAEALGSGRLVTTGVVGSHHALATCVHGRRVGLPTTLVVFPQPMTEHAREIAALNAEWADDLWSCGTFATQPFVEAAVRWRRRKEAPYVIPGGGSNPVGVLGYVTGGLELAEQVARNDAPRPDRITVAAGTLGTVAGLAIATALTNLTDRIAAIRIVPSPIANSWTLSRLVEGTVRLLTEAGVRLPDARLILDRVALDGDHLGGGYGVPTKRGGEAAAWFADRGLGLDPTYTAKAAGALLDAMHAEPDAVHLYWHTLSSVLPAEEVQAAGSGA